MSTSYLPTCLCHLQFLSAVSSTFPSIGFFLTSFGRTIPQKFTLSFTVPGHFWAFVVLRSMVSQSPGYIQVHVITDVS